MPKYNGLTPCLRDNLIKNSFQFYNLELKMTNTEVLDNRSAVIDCTPLDNCKARSTGSPTAVTKLKKKIKKIFVF